MSCNTGCAIHNLLPPKVSLLVQSQVHGSSNPQPVPGRSALSYVPQCGARRMASCTLTELGRRVGSGLRHSIIRSTTAWGASSGTRILLHFRSMGGSPVQSSHRMTLKEKMSLAEVHLSPQSCSGDIHQKDPPPLTFEHRRGSQNQVRRFSRVTSVRHQATNFNSTN